MRKFTKSVIGLAVVICLMIVVYGYANKTTVPQTIQKLSGEVKTGVAQLRGTQAQVPQGSGSVRYYFPRAGHNPQAALLDVINNAKSSLDVAIYSFTDTKIAQALIAAKNRGVSVRVMSDEKSSLEVSQNAVLLSLKKAGIPVKVNSHSGLMHLKVTIADKSVVTTGSFNYTKSAEDENDEVFVVLDNAQAATDFEKEFNAMWGDGADYRQF